jgi:hypothetical protein
MLRLSGLLLLAGALVPVGALADSWTADRVERPAAAGDRAGLLVARPGVGIRGV